MNNYTSIKCYGYCHYKYCRSVTVTARCFELSFTIMVQLKSYKNLYTLVCIHNTHILHNLRISPVSQSKLQQAGNACQGQTAELIGFICKLRIKSNVVNTIPGSVFTTIHFVLTYKWGLYASLSSLVYCNTLAHWVYS